MIELIFYLWSSVTDPYQATLFATSIQGRSDLADDLHAICYRESRCRAIQVHEIDRHLSRNGWVGQVRLGHLNPKCQPYEDGQWATRGAFGLSAASHWAYLFPCYPPQILDIPLVSALVAVAKYEKQCLKTRKGWCRVPRKVKRNNRR